MEFEFGGFTPVKVTLVTKDEVEVMIGLVEEYDEPFLKRIARLLRNHLEDTETQKVVVDANFHDDSDPRGDTEVAVNDSPRKKVRTVKPRAAIYGRIVSRVSKYIPRSANLAAPAEEVFSRAKNNGCSDLTRRQIDGAINSLFANKRINRIKMDANDREVFCAPGARYKYWLPDAVEDNDGTS